MMDLQHDVKEGRVRSLDEMRLHVNAIMGNDDKDEGVVVLEHPPAG